jgi:HTH-type transcriptional regulator, sugar sensing transcriptional regulator
MVVNNLVKKLLDSGFTEYEAKAYIALLGSGTATAYEIAKASGIPTSKIYEVISRLTEKGIILITNEKNKNKYIPIEPEEFIENRRKQLDSTLTELKNDLLNISSDSEISYIWNIHDYDYLISKAVRMIQEAKKSLLISTWNQEISYLNDLLKEKQKKGIYISIVHFGEVKINTGQIFQHPIEDTIYSEKGGRGFAMIADSKEALMGTVLDDNTVEGAWSANKGFVTLAEDYIKHDIYIMKIVKRFDKLLIRRFGPNYQKLRDVFKDEDEK